ncbi:MAG: tail protein X [Candidatus Gastranaerophilales bacterium]|nr:tail protein X [Candidatus Gastranaerophilales bacterium]
MNEYYEYITKDGDRWDLIAYDFYGNPTQYEPIIVANPDIPITPILASGLKLKIPALQENDLITFELPPWKC